MKYPFTCKVCGKRCKSDIEKMDQLKINDIIIYNKKEGDKDHDN